MLINIFHKSVFIQLICRSFHTTYQLKCGVLSYFYYSPLSNKCFEEDRRSLLNGLNTLKHRGPDGAPSFWINKENTVGLGHTRLAIIDLSEHGRQPLHSFDKKLHLSMNGELYDHDRIRQEAIENDNYQFTSRSDSEIAMYLYRKYDLKFAKYLRGEFAITMYDEQRKVCFLKLITICDEKFMYRYLSLYEIDLVLNHCIIPIIRTNCYLHLKLKHCLHLGNSLN